MIIKQTHTIPTSLSHVPYIASFTEDHPKVFSIIHKTNYSYSSPVSFSKHLFRLQPENDISQNILSYKLSCSSKTGSVCNFTGAFGNHASFLEIKEPYKELSIVSESLVSVSLLPKNMQLLHQPRTMPLIWMPWDRIMMQAYLQAPELPEAELFALAEYAMSFVDKNHHDVFEVLKDINQTIYREFTYDSGSSTLFTTPFDVFLHRKGVCQDFANLFICLARLLGIAARYRVGYIYTGGDYENKLQSDASHAWVEVYLPYLGWLGFDPTNGCLVEKNHIRVASGRSFMDATPTSGTIFEAPEGTKETMTTSVQVILLDSEENPPKKL